MSGAPGPINPAISSWTLTMSQGSQCEILLGCMIDAHLAASIGADPAGDTKLAKIHETLAGYRQKAKASSAALSTASGSEVGLLSYFKKKPVEAVALDMLLCMALNRTSTAVGPGHEVAVAPLAWLCDEEETPKVVLRIVDTVWPPDSPDQV